MTFGKPITVHWTTSNIALLKYDSTQGRGSPRYHSDHSDLRQWDTKDHSVTLGTLIPVTPITIPWWWGPHDPSLATEQLLISVKCPTSGYSSQQSSQGWRVDHRRVRAQLRAVSLRISVLHDLCHLYAADLRSAAEERSVTTLRSGLAEELRTPTATSSDQASPLPSQLSPGPSVFVIDSFIQWSVQFLLG